MNFLKDFLFNFIHIFYKTRIYEVYEYEMLRQLKEDFDERRISVFDFSYMKILITRELSLNKKEKIYHSYINGYDMDGLILVKRHEENHTCSNCKYYNITDYQDVHGINTCHKRKMLVKPTQFGCNEMEVK